jgi:photosystem I P700 chlorophyll a apoprotein A1
MHYHGAYYSNYHVWLKDSSLVTPSSHLVWSLVGQESLNASTLSTSLTPSCDSFYTGIPITAGFFHLWRSAGICSVQHLQYGCMASLIACIVCIQAAIYLSNTRLSNILTPSIHPQGVLALLGLSSISWSAHQFHIALPSYVHSSTILTATLGRIDPLVNYASTYVSVSSLALSCVHHVSVGVVLILIALMSTGTTIDQGIRVDFQQRVFSGWHAQLSICLGILGSLSIAFAHSLSLSLYPYLSSSYPTCVSIFCHHMWIGSLLLLGSSAHASIQLVRGSTTLSHTHTLILQHRHTLLTHLIWLNVFLGFHSFALYIHNDTLDALGRPEDIFSDNSIRLYPFFNLLSSCNLSIGPNSLFTSSAFALGTSDLLVNHIHAFSLHLTVLIVLKGILHSRTSRLISDKLDLGFRYPCDGPARGGTCQVSPWDHLFLSMFWMYNFVSILLFHYFWKMQSDVWSVSNPHEPTSTGYSINHITSGEYSIHSVTINGWLRNYLWSEATQVIQSYGRDAISAYTFVFIASHFVWSFSLMFLYSGRAYWQELIESIVWSHTKIKVIPHIQPRALSITQGRAVGVSHFLAGGIGCTWSFFLSRIQVLTS